MRLTCSDCRCELTTRDENGLNADDRLRCLACRGASERKRVAVSSWTVIACVALTAAISSCNPREHRGKYHDEEVGVIIVEPFTP